MNLLTTCDLRVRLSHPLCRRRENRRYRPTLAPRPPICDHARMSRYEHAKRTPQTQIAVRRAVWAQAAHRLCALHTKAPSNQHDIPDETSLSACGVPWYGCHLHPPKGQGLRACACCPCRPFLPSSSASYRPLPPRPHSTAANRSTAADPRADPCAHRREGRAAAAACWRENMSAPPRRMRATRAFFRASESLTGVEPRFALVAARGLLADGS